MALTPASVYHGFPASEGHDPDKDDIVALLTSIQTLAAGGAFAAVDVTLSDLANGTTSGDLGLVLSEASDGGLYEWNGSAWVFTGALPFVIGGETYAQLAKAWAESPTAPDPDDAASKSSKTWAGEAAVQAMLAQQIADGVDTTVLDSDDLPAVTTDDNGLVGRVILTEGVQIWQVVAGAWAFQFWLSANVMWLTRAEAVELLATYTDLPDGYGFTAGGLQYEVKSGATVISDMPGVVPAGEIYLEHFGSDIDPGSTAYTAALEYMEANATDLTKPKPIVGIGLARLHVSDGQSNAVGVFADDVDGNEAVDRQTPGVIVQRGDTGAWVPAASWKAAPFAGVGAPHGADKAGGTPNIGLSFAQRVNQEFGGADYLVHNARGGRSIEEWVNPASRPMWDEIKAKIVAALATPELDDVQYVTTMIRTQSEGDFNHEFGSGDTFPLVDTADFNNNYEIYRTYLANLETLWANLNAESWWGPDSTLILNSGSNLHTRYMPMKAMRDFARRHNNVVFVDASSLPTGNADTTDFTHFSGPAMDTLGYYYDFAAWQNRGRSDDFSDSIGGILSNRVGEPYRRGDDTVVFPPEAKVDANFNRLAVARGLSLTISAGAITVTDSFHAVGTEGAAGSDNLDTINGGTDGMLLYLRPLSSSQAIAYTSSGNLKLKAATRTTATNRSLLVLLYQEAFDEWYEISWYEG